LGGIRLAVVVVGRIGVGLGGIPVRNLGLQGTMPLFMTDSELEGAGGNVNAVVLKADAFIRDLQEQLEAEKGACADVQQRLNTVGTGFAQEC